MKTRDLKRIKKFCFGYEDIAVALCINKASAVVSANRYTKSGHLVRLKRNFYMLRERWDNLDAADLLRVANLLQVPSYVSLMSALSYYEVTTQIQRGFTESVATKRTKNVEIEERVFRYTKIDKKLYFGFSRREGIFIADPEKAFLDMVYLASLKRYSFDIGSLDPEKLDRGKVVSMARKFPAAARKALVDYGYAKKT
jgi:predicted transcriptional regulator of viral defense system